VCIATINYLKIVGDEEIGKKAVKINWGYKISTFLNQVNEKHQSQIPQLLEQLKRDFCSVQMIKKFLNR
jgi:hypothetical protein